MKRLLAPSIYLALAAVAALILRDARTAPPPPATERPEAGARPTEHLVTPAMYAEAQEAAGAPAPPFVAEATDGRSYSLADLTAGGGPLVLIFIKDLCPCSASAQPFFNRLHTVYGRARFVGVISDDLATARGWASAHRVRFPVLADPGKEVVRRYGARSSAYVALVGLSGRVERLWPGFSAGMLRELGSELARLSDSPARLIDVSGAPEELYSGCPYGLEVAVSGR